MSDLSPLLCFVSLGFAIFIPGLLFGFLLGSLIRPKSNNIYRPGFTLLNQNWGEASVRNLITSNFKPPDFHLLNNVTIPFQDGTTQIDQVLVSKKGLFVIEVKHYSGWIFGNEKSDQWQQSLYRVKNKFQNPIHQNFRHVKAIHSVLDFLPHEHIHSIVVFSGSAEFKTSVPSGVFYLNQLVDHLNSFQDDVISPNRLEFCVGRLECRRYELTRATDIQHRAYLAKKFGD